VSSRQPPSPADGTVRRIEVDPERLRGWVDRFAARHGALSTHVSGDAAVVTAPDGAVATLLAPWPCDGLARAGDPLQRLLDGARRARVDGILLVRRGGYAVGVAEGAALAESKVGRRHVQGRTKAGGWSQQRYARRRQAQAREAFRAAADTAARVLLPHRRRLEGLVTGGDRQAVAAVLADPRLAALHDLPQGRFLAVPDPRQSVLVDAVRRARAVAVEVHEPPPAESTHRDRHG
jgi:Actinobacteria/chloroflexi VLRF1 release factor